MRQNFPVVGRAEGAEEARVPHQASVYETYTVLNSRDADCAAEPQGTQFTLTQVESRSSLFSCKTTFAARFKRQR